MKRVLLLALVASSWGSSGQAADVQIDRSAPDAAAPTYVVRSSAIWGGYYFGIYAGGGRGHSNHDAPPDGPPTGDFQVSGALVGGTIGVNFQAGSFVTGVEADAGWANIKGNTTINCGGSVCETSNSGIITVRGRAGYAFDRVMPFLTAGIAFGDIRAEVIGSGAVNPYKTGLAIGGGIDWLLTDNLIAKLEYLYVDLGSTPCGVQCNSASPDNVSLKMNLVRGGLSYKLDW